MLVPRGLASSSQMAFVCSPCTPSHPSTVPPERTTGSPALGGNCRQMTMTGYKGGKLCGGYDEMDEGRPAAGSYWDSSV